MALSNRTEMIPMVEQFLKRFEEKLQLNDKVAVKWSIFFSNRHSIFIGSVILLATLYLTGHFHVLIACSGVFSAVLVFLCYFCMLNDYLNGGLVFAMVTVLSAGSAVMLAPRISTLALVLNGLGAMFLTMSLINYFLVLVTVRIGKR